MQPRILRLVTITQLVFAFLVRPVCQGAERTEGRTPPIGFGPLRALARVSDIVAVVRIENLATTGLLTRWPDVEDYYTELRTATLRVERPILGTESNRLFTMVYDVELPPEHPAYTKVVPFMFSYLSVETNKNYLVFLRKDPKYWNAYRPVTGLQGTSVLGLTGEEDRKEVLDYFKNEYEYAKEVVSHAGTARTGEETEWIESYELMSRLLKPRNELDSRALWLLEQMCREEKTSPKPRDTSTEQSSNALIRVKQRSMLPSALTP